MTLRERKEIAKEYNITVKMATEERLVNLEKNLSFVSNMKPSEEIDYVVVFASEGVNQENLVINEEKTELLKELLEAQERVNELRTKLGF